MNGPSLLSVLLVARGLTLAGSHLPMSGWSCIAFVWQDVALALGFAIVARVVRVRWLVSAAYVVIVIYTAVNVPIARTLSSPLTSRMIGAAGAPLTDSL